MQALLFVLGIPFLWLTGLAPVSKGPDNPQPDDLWEIDRDGLRQWKKFDRECKPCKGEGEDLCKRCKDGSAKDCVECEESRIAVCRSCGGDGNQYDPLAEQVCSFCDGSALWTCPACRGKGSYGIVGGSKQGQRCGPCKHTGILECEVCKGKRRIPVLRVGGKKPGKASAQSIEKVRSILDDTIADMRRFEPYGQVSDDRKDFEKRLKKTAKNLPVLKTLKKMVDADMDALSGKAQYVSYERSIRLEFRKFRDRSILLMENQLEVLDLCEERLEFNQKVRDK